MDGSRRCAAQPTRGARSPRIALSPARTASRVSNADASARAGGYISRTADESVLSVMDKPQWGYALFDAGCWGYASVTISTLAPLVFVRRTTSQKAVP